MKKARIVILTGSGKGKTTSAIGMIVRALAYEQKVLLVRFCKTEFSGELAILEKLPGMAIHGGFCGITPAPDNPEYERHVRSARRLFAAAKEAAPDFDLVVMDEICGVVARNMVDEDEVVDFLKKARPDQSIIFTGRGATPALVEIADTVSEIRCVKHGYHQGIRAQEGIEL